MSEELSLYEAMGGTYTEVDGILYPNIVVDDKRSDMDSVIYQPPISENTVICGFLI